MREAFIAGTANTQTGPFAAVCEHCEDSAGEGRDEHSEACEIGAR